jgi:hypothetical protein
MTMSDDKLPAASNSAEVDAFLADLNRTPAVRPEGGRGRLIFALDATASRGPTWDRACRIQGEMFEATAALGGLDVKLMFYRGFAECKASRWFTAAADLHRAMRAVGCLGGETQIERVLSHAIAESKQRRVHALVFVGDAMEEDADRLCKLAGELDRGGGVPPDRPVIARRLSQLRPGERRPAEGPPRRGRGLCRRRLSRARRPEREEGRRHPAVDGAIKGLMDCPAPKQDSRHSRESGNSGAGGVPGAPGSALLPG